MGTTRRSQMHVSKWVPFLLVVVGAAAYCNTFRVPFVFDDLRHISRNPELGNLWGFNLSPRVLTEFTFRINYALGGLAPAGFHITNLLIHVLAGLTLYGLVRRTLLLPGCAVRYGAQAVPLAATCAGLWLVHPLHTESVTYIVQRLESLSGLFIFLGLYCMARAVGNEHRERAWLGAALMVCAVGMGVKDIMVVLPIALFLYDTTFWSGSFGKTLRLRWRPHLAFALTWGIFLCLVLVFNGHKLLTQQRHTADVSPLLYCCSQSEIIVHYMGLIVWPATLRLNYEWMPVAGPGEVLVPLAFVIAAVLLACWLVVRKRPSGYLLFCFFLVLGPTSSIVPIDDFAFEHRLYAPAAAIIVLVVLLAYRVGRSLLRECGGTTKGVVWSVLVGGIVVALVARTLVRNADYADPVRLWTKEIQSDPSRPRAYNELAMTLISNGQFDEAKATAYRGLWVQGHGHAPTVQPTGKAIMELPLPADRRPHALAHSYAGVALHHMGRLDEALSHYVRVASLDAPIPEIYVNTARIHFSRNAYDQADEALAQLLRRDANHVIGLRLRGDVWVRKGDSRKALRFYHRVLALTPGDESVLALVRILEKRTGVNN